MKKCASCTKDLPDAALHCVFCGAKQPPAPAAQPAMAKTVMGYGGNEELNRLREQAAAANAARSNSPSSSPMSPAMPAPAPQPPRPQSASQPPPAGGYGQGNMAPTAGAQARTMFVDQGPPAGARPNSPSQHPPMQGPAVPGGMPLGGPSPMANVKTMTPDAARMAPSAQPGFNAQGPTAYGAPAPAPVVNPYNAPAANPYSAPAGGYNPQPVAQTPPYMTPSHNVNQGTRPIDPWKDTLRTMMFIWGGVLIACFAVPISLSPLGGWWNVVADAPGTAKIIPLLLAAVGILSIVVGAIPMATPARGAIAAVLGLAGLLVPIFLAEHMPEWKSFLSIGGTILLVPALFMRNEYTESPLPRILITVGALAALSPFLIPEHGRIPLVDLFKMLIDAPGAFKVLMILFVVYVLILVLSLLAWLPSPATAGAKVLAWVLLLWPLILTGAGIALSGGDGIDFEHALNPTVLGWAYGLAGGGKGGGGMALGGMMLGSAYLALSSYGLASVLGKKLE